MKTTTIVVYFIIGAVILTPSLAVVNAQSDILNTKILGLNPILVAVGITGIGVGHRVFTGILKSQDRKFSGGQLASSLMIGFFASLQLVIVAVQNIPADANELTQLALVATAVAATMGIDAGVKDSQKIVANRKNGAKPKQTGGTH